MSIERLRVSKEDRAEACRKCILDMDLRVGQRVRYDPSYSTSPRIGWKVVDFTPANRVIIQHETQIFKNKPLRSAVSPFRLDIDNLSRS